LGIWKVLYFLVAFLGGGVYPAIRGNVFLDLARGDVNMSISGIMSVLRRARYQ